MSISVFVAVQLILLELMVWLAGIVEATYIPRHAAVDETDHHALVSGLF